MRLLAFILTLCLIGCSSQKPSPAYAEEDVLARVGDEVILKRDLAKELAQRGYERSPESESQILHEMIDFRRLVLEGRSRGWHEDAEAKLALDKLVARRVQTSLQEGLPDEVAITDEEIQAAYEQDQQLYQEPASVRGAILVVRDDVEKAKASLESALGQLDQLESTDFGKLAVEFSHDQATRYQGGQMRWISEKQRQANRWGPKVMDALFALTTPGETSKIVEVPDGACVLRLIERQEGKLTPLEKVSNQLRAKMLKDRKEAAQHERMRSLAKKYPSS